MKNIPTAPTPNSSKKDPVQDLHAKIARRAWQLWQAQQQPAGREAEIWFEAECEVLGESSAAAFSAVNHAA